MKRTMVMSLLALGLTLGVVHPVAAQRATEDSILFRPDVERLFVEAMRALQAGNHDTAAALFGRNIRDFPRSHRATGSYIMGGKAYYLRGNYRESIRLLKDLIDIYPQSSYVDDAHYTLGLNYYRMGRYEDAAGEFLWTRQSTDDPRLTVRSERMLNLIAISHLSSAELQLLFQDASMVVTRALVQLRLGEKVYRSGDVKAALEILRVVAESGGDNRYVADAAALIDRVEQGAMLKVGVVLPLMLKEAKASLRELGLEFLDGIQMAVDEFNTDAVTKVNLEVRDSERDPSVAARQVTELCVDDKVVAVVGPVSSNEVFASAGIANAKGVPLITPTGTSNGIAAIGPYIFQANPDYDVRGRVMAEYAFTRMGARSFAVLSPGDAIGKLMAEAFLDEVRNLGGEIVDVQWYSAGATDLRSQLSDMRFRALKRQEVPVIDFSRKVNHADINTMLVWGVRQSLLDSLMETGGVADVNTLFGPEGKLIADSLNLPTQVVSLNYDSLGLPVTAIDAMFVPIAGVEEIAVVSSQLKLMNFRCAVLGTGDWNDPAELDQHRQYTDGVLFGSDVHVDQASPSYKVFASKFQKAHNKKPGVNVLFGYDTMKMLLQVIANGATYRNDIAVALPEVRGFAGHHSVISFLPQRVNGFMTILQFRGRTIRKVGDVDLAVRTLEAEVQP